MLKRSYAMKSIKPGRGPSMMEGVVCIIAALFGLLWTVGAADMTSSYWEKGFFHEPAFVGIGSIFPLFGVLFIAIAIALAIYSFRNATGKQRYSEYDIVDGHEEPDPLNERFGQPNDNHSADIPASSRAFCPYCGAPVKTEHSFCSSCGKKLSDSLQ